MDMRRILQKRINSPKVDLLDNNTQYTIRMEVPGTMPEDISIELNDNQIVLIHLKKPAPELSEVAIYRECRYGNITRRVKLPNKVHPLNINNGTFTVDNGMLNVSFVKMET
ncbi:Hsp20/alpha crystallin family protein [bacterium]|nr:Hsp20/alpha crystallin family protein [bacterium]NDG30487.1 Hsp20/alpha crystallin family protein [bacterium]